MYTHHALWQNPCVEEKSYKLNEHRYDVKPIAHQSMIAPFYLTQLLQPHQVVYAMEEAHHLLIDAIHEARSDRTPESTLPTT